MYCIIMCATHNECTRQKSIICKNMRDVICVHTLYITGVANANLYDTRANKCARIG